MSEIKWIKILTDMFDDDKIRLIQSMPEGDSLLVIWLKLLTQAGKCNAGGYVQLNEKTPYSPQMLSVLFDRKPTTVELALNTFRSFGMIDIDRSGRIFIENWEKHQNIEVMDKIREQTKKRVQEYRGRKKVALLNETNPVNRVNEEKESSRLNGIIQYNGVELYQNITDVNDLEHCNVTCNVTVTTSNDRERERERDIKDIVEELDFFPPEEKKKDSPPYLEIVRYLNEKVGTNYKATTKKTQDQIKARLNEGFTIDDFKAVIDNMVSQWINDPKMKQYLRPETLFGTKFESYLNIKIVGKSQKKSTPPSGGNDFLAKYGFK